MMRGIAVPTMVWSSAASSSVSSRPVRVPANWRRVRLCKPGRLASGMFVVTYQLYAQAANKRGCTRIKMLNWDAL